jgi:hypothetical protein
MAIRWSILTYNFMRSRDKNQARLCDLAAQFGARRERAAFLPFARFLDF